MMHTSAWMVSPEDTLRASASIRSRYRECFGASSSEAAATRRTRHRSSSSGFSECTQHGVVGKPAENRLFGYLYEDDIRLMRLLEEELY